ncbi:MAG: hypothetical protein COX57_03650 [Alphaproteobacteria bacterium CG_4_10_14_0_2_um_filter_63_37]|nr:MAG: hypothetical protein AUJ55_05945 [Proteobacteria bacterium CG1_02_64_396]PJA25355.1 MAG: hypothetical protein COX57_03650 [Alphaproteobacteria bacterium CG_4_10_14_0_2_um_filter_63_37]
MISPRLLPLFGWALALSTASLLSGCGPDVSEEELAKLRSNQTLLTKLQADATQWAKERKQLQEAVQAAKIEIDRLSASPQAATPAPKEVEASAAPVAPKEPTPPPPAPVATAPQSQDVLVLGNLPIFEPGSVDITPAGAAKLKEIAPALRRVAAGQKIVVVGHADPIPPGKNIKERLPDNWAISSARAQAVIRYLVWGEGLPADRFVLEAMGSSDPVAGNDTRAGRQQNQRVEIRIQGGS